jgi:hypothetical protein
MAFEIVRGNSVNTSTVVIGLVLIAIGIIFGWLCCLAAIFIPIGFIIMVIGLMQSEKPTTVIQYYGAPPPGHVAPGEQVRYSAGPPGAASFCQYCGRQIAPDAAWCPGCGRPLKKQS